MPEIATSGKRWTRSRRLNPSNNWNPVPHPSSSKTANIVKTVWKAYNPAFWQHSNITRITFFEPNAEEATPFNSVYIFHWKRKHVEKQDFSLAFSIIMCTQACYLCNIICHKESQPMCLGGPAIWCSSRRHSTSILSSSIACIGIVRRAASAMTV